MTADEREARATLVALGGGPVTCSCGDPEGHDYDIRDGCLVGVFIKGRLTPTYHTIFVDNCGMLTIACASFGISGWHGIDNPIVIGSLQ